MSDTERKQLDARAVLPDYMQDPEKKVLVGGASAKDVEKMSGAFLQEETPAEAARAEETAAETSVEAAPEEAMEPAAEEVPAEAAAAEAAAEAAEPADTPAEETAKVATGLKEEDEKAMESLAGEAAVLKAEEEKEAPKKQGAVSDNLKMILKDVLIACVIALAISCFVRPTIVRETSMQPTIQPNDYLLMSRQAYRFGDVERGDIIIFRSELKLDDTHNKLLIKRVIALPGDTLAIKSGEVYVNGEKLTEDYIYEGGTPGEIGEMVIPDGQIFVMGDHREVSVDSRALGCIDEDNIEGKAFFRLFPLTEIGTL